MSKNTGTSELINYFDLGVNGAVGIAGSLTVDTIASAATDTDKFLVSDTGVIKYRTGAEVLSDIGGQAAGNYVTLDTTQTITGQKTISREAVAYSGTTQSFLINGAVGNGALTINSIASGYTYQTFAQGGVGKFEIGIVGTGGNGSFYINRNIQVGETGASIYIKKADGFIGINNLTPSFQLDVTGKIYSSTEIQANTAVINTTGGYATFGSNTSSTPIRIGRNASSNDIIVAASGNVLIGTTTDGGFNLTVSGTSRFTNVMSIDAGAFGNEALILNSSTNQQYIAINSGTGFEAMTKYFNPTAGNWYTGIRISDGLGSTSSYHIYSSTYGNDVFVLNTDATARFVGGVGIGVAPATNLHVQGPTVSYGQARITSTSGSGGEASINYGRTDQTIDNRWTVGQGVASIGDSFGFYTGGSVRLNITTSGNVLIGTTTDSGYKLDVQQGATNAAKFNFAVTGVWGGGANQDHGMLISGARYTSDTNTSLLHIINTDNTSLFRVTDYGKVGIGTTSPAAKLYVGATVNNASSDISTTAQLITPRATIAYPLTVSSAGSGVTNDQIRITYNYGVGFSATAYIASYLENASLAETGLAFGVYKDGLGLIEGMRLTPDKYIRLASNSGGIQFNGDTAAANALDDYEEGTWTPTLPNGGSLSTVAARYVKIGTKITVSFYVNNVTPTNNSSNFIIGGLPFVSIAISLYYGGSFGYMGTGNLSTYLPITGSGFSYIYFHANNGTAATKTNANYIADGGNKEFIVTLTYFTS